MPEQYEQTHQVHTTETDATGPARHAALQAIAEMSDRGLCLFHYEAAKNALEFLEHEIRDYSDRGEQTEPITEREAGVIVQMIDKVTASLALVRAVAVEAGEHTARALPENAAKNEG